MLQKQMVILKVGYQKVDINISCENLGKYPIYSSGGSVQSFYLQLKLSVAQQQY